ncbi:MAG: GNAT family N-acetyltransferase [Candidatus Rokuibacteriota bacterium]
MFTYEAQVGGSLHRLAASRSPNLAAELRSLGPGQPGLDVSSAQAKAVVFGHPTWVFTLFEDGTRTALGFGSIERGRIGATLGITLTGGVPDSAAFWAGLRRFASDQWVTRLWIESIGAESSRSPIPALPGERGRYSDVTLYALDLRKEEDLHRQMSENHRRNVRKAERSGVAVTCSPGPEEVRAHLAVIGASIERRSRRGEPTWLKASREDVERIMATQASRLYQARLDGEIVSSKLVFTVDEYAYYDSGGSSQKGMSVGASHFLMREIIIQLKADKMRVLNLDVASKSSGGLARYKAEFGASTWRVDRAYFEQRDLRAMALNGLSGLARWPGAAWRRAAAR